jgi:hypothetical protein
LVAPRRVFSEPHVAWCIAALEFQLELELEFPMGLEPRAGLSPSLVVLEFAQASALRFARPQAACES